MMENLEVLKEVEVGTFLCREDRIYLFYIHSEQLINR